MTKSIDTIVTLDDAKDYIRWAETPNGNSVNKILTEGEFHQIIGKMSATVPGSEVTLLYSGDFGTAKSWQIGEAIGFESGGKVATMQQTDVGKLLAFGPFQDAVGKTAGTMGLTKEHLLFGEDLNGLRVNSNSLSDVASKHFAGNIEGSVKILTNIDASPDSILAKTEFPEILRSQKITDIDGIDLYHFNDRLNTLYNEGKNFEGAAEIIRQDVIQHSHFNTYANIKYTDPSGSLSHVGGIDTGKFFKGNKVTRINTIMQGTENIRWLAKSFDAAKLQSAKSVLGKFGVIGDGLVFGFTAVDAFAAYQNGDTQKAANIMAEWGVGFTGGLAGGAMASLMAAEVFSPLLAFGPPGVFMAGVLTIGAGITGGVVGQETFLELYDICKEMGMYLENEVVAVVNQLEHSLFGQFIKQALTFGDPHKLTTDVSLGKTFNDTPSSVLLKSGLSYDFQQPGEFVLIEENNQLGTSNNNTNTTNTTITKPPFTLQVRQKLLPTSNSVSINTAVATELGNNTQLQISLPPKDTQCSSVDNDFIVAPNGNTTVLFSGEDEGGITLSTGGDVSFFSSQGSFRNSFGYYVKNDTGYPEYGELIWANTRAVPQGSRFNYSLSIPKDRLGFFLISNGFSYQNWLGDGLPASFQIIRGAWAVVVNNIPLSSQYSDTNPPAHAFYSDTRLNTDHVQHQRFNGNTQGWEDCYGGGDQSFNDVVFGTSINQALALTGGDTLVGGQGRDNFGYVLGVDRVDTIKQFNATQDVVTLYGTNANATRVIDVNGGSFIQTSPVNTTLQGIFVENVNTTALTPRVNFTNNTNIPTQCTGNTIVPIYDVHTNTGPLPLKSGEIKAVGDGLIYRSGRQYTVVTGGGDGFTTTLLPDHMDVQPFFLGHTNAMAQIQ